jgi:membrane protease YdiL (CAAX protease family)
LSLAPILLETEGQEEFKPSQIRYDAVAFIMTMFAAIIVLWYVVEFANSIQTGAYTQTLVWIAFTAEFGLAVGVVALMRPRMPWESPQANIYKVLAYGLLGGVLIVMITVLGSLLAFSFGLLPYEVSTTQDMRLALLAPVAETLMFQVFIFGGLMALFKNLHWLFSAGPTSLMFALYHFFAIHTHPVLIIIYVLGSLVLDWVFAKTLAIGTPMVSHFFNNMIPSLPAVAEFFAAWWWLVVLPIIIIAFLLFLGGQKR